MATQRKLKVLQVNKMYYPEIGGVEKVVQQISEGLNDELDLQVLACQTKGKARNEKINNVKVTRTSSLGVYFSMPVSFSFPFVFRKKVKDADIVHIHLPNPLADLSLLLSGYKGKVVVSWHSDIIKQKKIMFFLKPLILKTLKRADKIIVATEGHIKGSDYLKEFEEKCVVVPFGIEQRKIPKLESLDFEASNQEKTILFIGRLVYYKGVKYLIEAMKDVENAKLRIVGDGSDRTELEMLTKDLGITQKVEFLGSLSDEDLIVEYKNCDFFVLPSVAKSEAFGLVQIEAMSYGKPVINTRLDSGVPYVSIDGETGLTVEAKNSKELANAIKKLVEDDNLRLTYGRNAYERVLNNYILEENNQEIMNLYQNIL